MYSEGATGAGWIDLFANSNITVVGDTYGDFAVHASQCNPSSGPGGQIAAKSVGGNISASGLAFQADPAYGLALLRAAALTVVSILTFFLAARALRVREVTEVLALIARRSPTRDRA